MYEMLLHSNLNGSLKSAKKLWDKKINSFPYCNFASTLDLLNYESAKFGNLKDFVLYSIKYKHGCIFSEYFIVLVHDIEENRYRLDLCLINYANSEISSYKNYEGVYPILNSVYLENELNISVDLSEILSFELRNYVEKDIPLSLYK